MYKIEFTSHAQKSFLKLPTQTQKGIALKLKFFSNSDNPLLFAKALTNYSLGGFRFRIGDYRVTFDIEETTMVILEVGHRKEIYR